MAVSVIVRVVANVGVVEVETIKNAKIKTGLDKVTIREEDFDAIVGIDVFVGT